MTTTMAPIGGERTAELDVIRGFALFGVMLINLFGHPEFAIPERALAALPTAAIDHTLGGLLQLLMEGKAPALFSMLVLMAVITSMMASPVFELVYGRKARASGELGATSGTTAGSAA